MRQRRQDLLPFLRSRGLHQNAVGQRRARLKELRITSEPLAGRLASSQVPAIFPPISPTTANQDHGPETALRETSGVYMASDNLELIVEPRVGSDPRASRQLPNDLRSNWP